MAAILVVDDDADHCDVMARILQRAGHYVFKASNGWEALVALDNSYIDAVILDLMMPGMDGATFLSILRNDRRRQHLPVIVLTGVHDSAMALRAQRLGVHDVLAKSDLSFSELLDDVNQLVAGSTHTGGFDIPTGDRPHN
jgi:CheY-like chemotaxis protein